MHLWDMYVVPGCRRKGIAAELRLYERTGFEV
jgi:hypothetical protein